MNDQIKMSLMKKMDPMHKKAISHGAPQMNPSQDKYSMYAGSGGKARKANMNMGMNPNS